MQAATFSPKERRPRRLRELAPTSLTAAAVDEDMPSVPAQQRALKQDMRDQGVDINFPSKRQKRKKMAPAALASPPGAQPLSPTTVIGQDARAVTLLLGANPSFGTESGSSGTKEHSW